MAEKIKFERVKELVGLLEELSGKIALIMNREDYESYEEAVNVIDSTVNTYCVVESDGEVH